MPTFQGGIKKMLCDTCMQLREKHSTHIICNIQQAQMINVKNCGFYEHKQEEPMGRDTE